MTKQLDPLERLRRDNLRREHSLATRRTALDHASTVLSTRARLIRASDVLLDALEKDRGEPRKVVLAGQVFGAALSIRTLFTVDDAYVVVSPWRAFFWPNPPTAPNDDFQWEITSGRQLDAMYPKAMEALAEAGVSSDGIAERLYPSPDGVIAQIQKAIDARLDGPSLGEPQLGGAPDGG